MSWKATLEKVAGASSDLFTVRTMNSEDLQLAIDWAATEGWNPGLDDAAAFHQADPRGFFIGELEGEPVGAMSAVRYPEEFSFIGLFIVRPEFRGPGFGSRIANIALRHTEGTLTGVDGVFEKESSYRKFGFKTAHKSYRFEYRRDWSTEHKSKETKRIRLAEEVSFDAITRYDRTCFPSCRDAFLREWLTMPQANSLVMVDGDEITGLGTIRTCREGYKIGPLFADDVDRAADLLHALTDFATPSQSIYIDMPEINEPGMQLARALDMHEVFGTARMYNGPAPDIHLDRIFGITSFELG